MRSLGSGLHGVQKEKQGLRQKSSRCASMVDSANKGIACQCLVAFDGKDAVVRRPLAVSALSSGGQEGKLFAVIV